MSDLRKLILAGWIAVGCVGLVLIIYTRPGRTTQPPLQYNASKDAGSQRPDKSAGNKSAAVTPAQAQATPAKQPTPAVNLKEAVIGKWQIQGHKEIHQWQEDGTLVMTTIQGKTLSCRYVVMGGGRVKVIPEDGNPMTSPIWSVEVYGDTLSVTSASDHGPTTDHFVRVKPNGELGQLTLPQHGKVDESIAGSWASTGSNEPMHLLPDGTFKFGENSGQWQIVNGEIVASDKASNITWKMALSPDGHTLSGHFSTFIHGGGVAGTITLTR